MLAMDTNRSDDDTICTRNRESAISTRIDPVVLKKSFISHIFRNMTKNNADSLMRESSPLHRIDDSMSHIEVVMMLVKWTFVVG